MSFRLKSKNIVAILGLFLLFFQQGCVDNRKRAIVEEFQMMQEDDLGAVMLFWASECPLCLNYYKDMVELSREYKTKGLPFYFVFTGADAKSEAVESFLLKFSEKERYILDPETTIATAYDATVTPQVIIVNQKMETVYSGKIDNWMNGLGQKRQVVDSFYLKDALIAVENGKKPEISKTVPVGCFIQ